MARQRVPAPGSPIRIPIPTAARARHAALSAWRDADDPELVAARRQYQSERLAEHIRAVVDAAPPLSAEQRERLASLLAADGTATSGPTRAGAA